MDSSCWTCVLALTAQTALVVVDVCQVVLDDDCIELTYLLALATTDTSIGTCLACYSALVFVDAHHYHATVLRTFLAQLDDVAWTCANALAAASTFLVIHLWQTSLRVHVDSIELAGCHTVATTQTAERTSRLTYIAVMQDLATLSTIVNACFWSCLARTIAANYCYFGVDISDRHSKDLTYCLHRRCTAYRAEKSIERVCFDAAFGKSTTASKTATTAVSARQCLLHLIDAWIFFYLELLSHEIQ